MILLKLADEEIEGPQSRRWSEPLGRSIRTPEFPNGKKRTFQEDNNVCNSLSLRPGWRSGKTDAASYWTARNSQLGDFRKTPKWLSEPESPKVSCLMKQIEFFGVDDLWPPGQLCPHSGAWSCQRHVVGCSLATGTGRLVIKGKINAGMSRDILEENLLQSSRPQTEVTVQLSAGHRPSALSQDIKAIASGQSLNVLESPSQRSDLDHIQQSWNVCERCSKKGRSKKAQWEVTML